MPGDVLLVLVRLLCIDHLDCLGDGLATEVGDEHQQHTW